MPEVALRGLLSFNMTQHKDGKQCLHIQTKGKLRIDRFDPTRKHPLTPLPAQHCLQHGQLIFMEPAIFVLKARTRSHTQWERLLRLSETEELSNGQPLTSAKYRAKTIAIIPQLRSSRRWYLSLHGTCANPPTIKLRLRRDGQLTVWTNGPLRWQGRTVPKGQWEPLGRAPRKDILTYCQGHQLLLRFTLRRTTGARPTRVVTLSTLRQGVWQKHRPHLQLHGFYLRRKPTYVGLFPAGRDQRQWIHLHDRGICLEHLKLLPQNAKYFIEQPKGKAAKLCIPAQTSRCMRNTPTQAKNERCQRDRRALSVGESLRLGVHRLLWQSRHRDGDFFRYQRTDGSQRRYKLHKERTFYTAAMLPRFLNLHWRTAAIMPEHVTNWGRIERSRKFPKQPQRVASLLRRRFLAKIPTLAARTRRKRKKALPRIEASGQPLPFAVVTSPGYGLKRGQRMLMPNHRLTLVLPRNKPTISTYKRRKHRSVASAHWQDRHAAFVVHPDRVVVIHKGTRGRMRMHRRLIRRKSQQLHVRRYPIVQRLRPGNKATLRYDGEEVFVNSRDPSGVAIALIPPLRHIYGDLIFLSQEAQQRLFRIRLPRHVRPKIIAARAVRFTYDPTKRWFILRSCGREAIAMKVTPKEAVVGRTPQGLLLRPGAEVAFKGGLRLGLAAPAKLYLPVVSAHKSGMASHDWRRESSILPGWPLHQTAGLLAMLREGLCPGRHRCRIQLTLRASWQQLATLETERTHQQKRIDAMRQGKSNPLVSYLIAQDRQCGGVLAYVLLGNANNRRLRDPIHRASVLPASIGKITTSLAALESRDPRVIRFIRGELPDGLRHGRYRLRGAMISTTQADRPIRRIPFQLPNARRYPVRRDCFTSQRCDLADALKHSCNIRFCYLRLLSHPRYGKGFNTFPTAVRPTALMQLDPLHGIFHQLGLFTPILTLPFSFKGAAGWRTGPIVLDPRPTTQPGELCRDAIGQSMLMAPLAIVQLGTTLAAMFDRKKAWPGQSRRQRYEGPTKQWLWRVSLATFIHRIDGVAFPVTHREHTSHASRAGLQLLSEGLRAVLGVSAGFPTPPRPGSYLAAPRSVGKSGTGQVGGKHGKKREDSNFLLLTRICKKNISAGAFIINGNEFGGSIAGQLLHRSLSHWSSDCRRHRVIHRKLSGRPKEPNHDQ